MLPTVAPHAADERVRRHVQPPVELGDRRVAVRLERQRGNWSAQRACGLGVVAGRRKDRVWAQNAWGEGTRGKWLGLKLGLGLWGWGWGWGRGLGLGSRVRV